MRTEAYGTASGPVSGFLENPVVGMAPWIVFSLLVGPGRFEISAGIALASAVTLVVLGRVLHRGSSWKLLEVADVVFGSDAGSGDRLSHAAWRAGVVMTVSNSTGVSRPRAACR
ncbi:hypothetical protein ACEPPI_36770, partial [Streptomyces sp. AB3(2024)]